MGEKYNCCQANHARCNSCKEGLSEEEDCKKSLPRVPPGCNREGCCKSFTAKCRACNRGVSEEVFCKQMEGQKFRVPGCERNFRDCKKDPSASGCKWIKCCKKFTAKCFACSQDKSEEEIWSPRLREVWLMISAQSATFGCLLLSLPIRAALAVPFWRGFLGIHFKSMFID